MSFRSLGLSPFERFLGWLAHVPSKARNTLASVLPIGRMTVARRAERRKPDKPNENSIATDREASLATVVGRYRSILVGVAFFSCLINLLMLTGPLFMLQVYDRVLSSQSVPTLVVLVLLVAGLFAILGILDAIRSRIMARLASEATDAVADRVFERYVAEPTRHGPNGPASRSLRDLSVLQRFVAGPIPFAIFDAFWMPLYILLLFAFHWTLGMVATVGAVILVALALVNEHLTRKKSAEAAQYAVDAERTAVDGRHNAEVAVALNMVPQLRQQWLGHRSAATDASLTAADRNGMFLSLTKSIRLFLQSAILAVGAVLVIGQLASAGIMITASIIMGRALAPIEQSIGQWQTLLHARAAFRNLKSLLAGEKAAPAPVRLPEPVGSLSVENLTVFASETDTALLSGINFHAEPGTAIGVIGPSASGKSTLARALTGIIAPSKGVVKLSGAALDQWPLEQRAAALGYLPQDVELFDGTVASNIARLRSDADDAQIVRAAMMAGAHDLILDLPDGYNTRLGVSGYRLSGGQRQRIGFARALFGDPVLVILDEPNSNLDAAGDNALSSAIKRLKAIDSTVIVMAHRPSAIAAVDRLLYIDKGSQLIFGTKEEVLQGLDFRGQRSAA